LNKDGLPPKKEMSGFTYLLGNDDGRPAWLKVVFQGLP